MNKERRLSADQVDRLAAAAASSLVARIQALNQYVQIDVFAKSSLKRIYVESWGRLVQTREVESTLRTFHFPRIRAFVEEVYPQALAAGLKSARELGKVPSSQYSPELQLRLMRLEPLSAMTPILDIGCGSDGNLVRFLQSHRTEAYGIDRSIRQKVDYLAEADWFDYDYGHRKWGTIVSHLSLANHLGFAQRYDEAAVPSYLGVFARILDSISVRGTLILVPAVELLQNQVEKSMFRTTTWQFPPAVKVMQATRIAP